MDHRYVGVRQRSFQSAVVHLLETDYGVLGSRRVLEMLAEDVTRLAREFHPAASCVPSGWLVFTGTKVTGRKAQPGKSAGDYPLVTLSWPVLLAEDVQALLDMPPGRPGRQQRRALLKRRVQRLIEHGLDHPQGPVTLTLADLSLMVGCSVGQMSRLVNELRQETGQALPTKGYFFDQGMRPSHKAEIIALYEQGWDEAAIARQTQHAQPCVGRYLRDYERVKLLLKKGLKTPEIAPIIDMRHSVLEEYIALIQQYHPELLNDANKPNTT